MKLNFADDLSIFLVLDTKPLPLCSSVLVLVAQGRKTMEVDLDPRSREACLTELIG